MRKSPIATDCQKLFLTISSTQNINVLDTRFEHPLTQAVPGLSMVKSSRVVIGSINGNQRLNSRVNGNWGFSEHPQTVVAHIMIRCGV